MTETTNGYGEAFQQVAASGSSPGPSSREEILALQSTLGLIRSENSHRGGLPKSRLDQLVQIAQEQLQRVTISLI